MAGRRHHYLPRFLQRPFAFRQKGKHFYVHAHHRAHGAYGTDVMELGQKLDFYGGPEDTTLDDAITAGERQLAITVNRSNSGEPVAPQADYIPISCSHLRTEWLGWGVLPDGPKPDALVRTLCLPLTWFYAEMDTIAERSWC